MPRNPFENLPPAEAADLAHLEDWVRHALACDADVLLVLGERGLGKTTHLLALRRALEQRGRAAQYVRVRYGDSVVLPAPQTKTTYLLDEADPVAREQLVGFLWAVCDSGGRAVLAAHRDPSRFLRRRGLTVERYRLAPLSTPEATGALIRARVQATGGELRLPPAVLARLHGIARGNPRLVLEILYEVWEDLGPGAEVSDRDLEAAVAQLRQSCPELAALL